MRRVNSKQQAVDSGKIVVDSGDGVFGEIRTALSDGPGWIDITSSLSDITSGNLYIAKELNTVWIEFSDLVVDNSSSFVQWDSVLPLDFRPTRMVDLALKGRASSNSDGPVRVSISGQIVVYQPRDMIRGLVSYPVLKSL